MYKEGDYTPEALRNLKIGYESLFIEVPIVIRNSPLTNIMMSELQEMIPEEEGSKFLDLGTASVLEGLYIYSKKIQIYSYLTVAFPFCFLSTIHQQAQVTKLIQRVYNDTARNKRMSHPNERDTAQHRKFQP